MPVNVTGTAISPNGLIKPGAAIVFRRARPDVVAQSGSFVIPDDLSIVTAIDGTVDFDIMPGQYIASTRAVGNRNVQFAFNVPDVLTADFVDCIGAAWVPVPPDSVTEAQTARDESEAARDEAVAVANAMGFLLNVTNGSNITSALTSALVSNPVVTIPPGSYTVGTWVLPSNRVVKMDGVILTHSSEQFMTATNAVKSSLIGGEIVGPHSSTSYQIILTNCTAVNIETQMSNGNSGVHLVRCVGCKVHVTATEMRGTAIRLSGSSNNDIALYRGRNISSFGVNLALDGATPCEANTIFAEKYADGATITAYQGSSTGSAFYDVATGRIGLASVSIAVGNNGNSVRSIARDTLDHGVSITSDNNSGSMIVAENCGGNGLHLFGSGNSLTGVAASGNAQSGIGIARFSTTGTASNNTIVGSSTGNAHYGVRIVDIATGNTVISSTGFGNLVGTILDESTGQNIVISSGANSFNAAQVSFVGVSNLSPGYSANTAYFRSDQGWCDFMLTLRFTPTYTTPGSPGEFRISIPGLPTARETPIIPVGSISGIVWPAGATGISGRFEGGTVLRLRASGPGVAPVSLTTAHFTSGVQVEFTLTGRYPLA